MPIEGPLRELDIHDLIQLLDLSRKTGALRVTSSVRDNVGTVYFDGGQVVYATVRSNPHPLGAMLVRSGRITEAELARARARQLAAGDGRRLGDILVEDGVVAARELDRHLRLQHRHDHQREREGVEDRPDEHRVAGQEHEALVTELERGEFLEAGELGAVGVIAGELADARKDRRAHVIAGDGTS